MWCLARFWAWEYQEEKSLAGIKKSMAAGGNTKDNPSPPWEGIARGTSNGKDYSISMVVGLSPLLLPELEPLEGDLLTG